MKINCCPLQPNFHINCRCRCLKLLLQISHNSMNRSRDITFQSWNFPIHFHWEGWKLPLLGSHLNHGVFKMSYLTTCTYYSFEKLEQIIVGIHNYKLKRIESYLFNILFLSMLKSLNKWLPKRGNCYPLPWENYKLQGSISYDLYMLSYWNLSQLLKILSPIFWTKFRLQRATVIILC